MKENQIDVWNYLTETVQLDDKRYSTLPTFGSPNIGFRAGAGS
jgi:hypothetical protein